MQVILLERVEKLGELGDAVDVKAGFARNYLLPQGKALRATAENLAEFEKSKAERVKANDAKKGEAEKLKDKIHEKEVIIIRAASEAGHLYGSVTSRDVSNAITESLKLDVDRTAVVMTGTSKMLGIFDFSIRLHAEVMAVVKVNIAQSAEEAKLQSERVAKGLPALAIGEEEDDRPKQKDSRAKAIDAAEEALAQAGIPEAETGTPETGAPEAETGTPETGAPEAETPETEAPEAEAPEAEETEETKE